LPPVREYVNRELQIKCEVPALQLLDDGSIVGSAKAATADDILSPSLSLRSKPLDIALGPDSVATLSFTSGSTGIPKGVRGRHYSLTHFFPWMSERFEMSENERFSMLSGIAHDPIQRDSESVSSSMYKL
jgi:L-aminoadipate-semialdehyde dehydrogenase